MAEDTVVTEPESPQFIEEGPTLPVLLTEDFVKQFEKGVEVYKRWVTVCYRLTRESHWLRRGDKFHLQGPGAEALMNPLGISFDRPTVTREDKSDSRGTFYLYWCEGYVESKALRRRGWYVGYCDSRDVFFTANPAWTPTSGEGDVKKSAFTNWMVNSVTRIAGIRDPDPVTLQNAGLDVNKIQVADYSGRRTPEAEASTISEAQGKRLFAIARGKGYDYEQHIRPWLKTFGIDSINQIKRKDYEELVAQVEAQKVPKGSNSTTR